LPPNACSLVILFELEPTIGDEPTIFFERSFENDETSIYLHMVFGSWCQLPLMVM
jgi:hypothetical protein